MNSEWELFADIMDEVGITPLFSMVLVYNDMVSKAHHLVATKKLFQQDPIISSIEEHLALSEKKLETLKSSIEKLATEYQEFSGGVFDDCHN